MKYTYQEFQDALIIVNSYKNELESHFKEIQKIHSAISPFTNVTKETRFEDIEGISTKLRNALRWTFEGVETVGDLKSVKLKDFRSIRNVGKKTEKELNELCYYAGVNLIPL